MEGACGSRTHYQPGSQASERFCRPPGTAGSNAPGFQHPVNTQGIEKWKHDRTGLWPLVARGIGVLAGKRANAHKETGGQLLATLGTERGISSSVSLHGTPPLALLLRRFQMIIKTPG